MYCSQRCRDADTANHNCRRILDRSTDTYSRNCYTIQSFRYRSQHSIPICVELSEENKASLLSSHNRTELELGEARRILGELRSWNSSLAEQFVVKDAIPFSNCPLRMIVASDTGIRPKKIDSYIVLSYAWRPPKDQGNGKKHSIDPYHWIPLSEVYRPPRGLEEIPLCKRLWDFLLDMRESEEEGIWIDQVCIDQENDIEKAAAIACMDSLYGSARLVFIALEDVRLTNEEACTLSAAFAKISADPSWNVPVNIARTLFNILRKILNARLFSRAWCFHEFHTSSQKIVALHYEASQSQHSSDVIGLVNLGDFQFSLPYLENNQFKSEYPDLLPKMLRFFGGQGYAYSNIAGNTLSFKSSYTRDKVTVALNISRLPLAFSPNAFTNNKDMNEEDVCLQLLMLFLAAGDITTLTTRGRKVKYKELGTERTSWLMWPDETSWSTRHNMPLREGISMLSKAEICLDLLILPETNFHSPANTSISKAQNFLGSDLGAQILSVYGIEIYTQNESGEAELDPATVSSLACVIECGLDWMGLAWSVTKRELLPEIELNLAQVQHLGPQCMEYIFSTELSYTQAAASFPFLVCVLILGSYWDMSLAVDTGESGEKAICDLKIINNNFCVPAPSEHKLYGTIQKKEFERKGTILAVPKVLAGQEFTLSDRLWLLKSVKKGSGTCWRVLEKVGLLACPNIEASGGVVSLMPRQIVVG